MKHDSLLRRWHSGRYDLTEALIAPEVEAPFPDPVYQPKTDKKGMVSQALRSRKLYVILCAVFCLCYAAILISAVAGLPDYGDPAAPTVRQFFDVAGTSMQVAAPPLPELPAAMTGRKCGLLQTNASRLAQ